MRPKIISHMVSSIDGRLLPDRWTQPKNDSKEKLLALYEQVADGLNADGWLVGRKSMAYYAKGTPKNNLVVANYTRDAFIAPGRQGHHVAIVVDPKGKLHYHQGNADGNHIIAILAEKVSNNYLAELRASGISYLFAGQDGNNLQLAMSTLGETFGIKKILLEGGGLINGAFLNAELIDEISLLIYPGIDGLSGISSIFEYVGQEGALPAKGLSLQHLSTETLEAGMVWLRYEVLKKE